MKKILCCFAALLLMAGAVGCACSNVPATPSPSPSGKLTVSPGAMATPALSASPDASSSPDASESPALGTSPDAASSPDASVSPDAAATIPDFKEGTEVKPEDAPEVKAAVTAKYPDAQIKKIKHAMKDGKQVYAVELENGGKTETAYVLPDGKLLDDAAATAKP